MLVVFDLNKSRDFVYWQSWLQMGMEIWQHVKLLRFISKFRWVDWYIIKYFANNQIALQFLIDGMISHIARFGLAIVNQNTRSYPLCVDPNYKHVPVGGILNTIQATATTRTVLF